MSSSVNSVEDVCNAALARIGYPRRLGDIYEGTRASKTCLDLYANARDGLLRTGDWGFANRSVTLTVLKTAPSGGYGTTPWTNSSPPPPWEYEYGWPTDCLRLLYIQSTPPVLPVLDPHPFLFKIYNDDSFTPAQRTVLANSPGIIMNYIAQITDMTTWDALFVEAMTQKLAKQFTIALNNGQQLVDLLKAESQLQEKDTGEAEAKAES